ncbi:MAG: ABC transporter ATP-binding protein [Alphaproteobacteria bacterium]
MGQSQSAITLAGVELTLDSAAGPVHILRGIDLDVKRGERVAILGPSGSGKTTMLMVLAGLEQPSAGQVTLAGADLSTLNEDGRAKLRRHEVGIVFQSFHLVPTLNALDNVAMPLDLAGVRDARERAEAALARVGLADRMTHYPLQLSGGEQQRVALARALVNEPALILADEPTGNLDGTTGSKIADLLFDLHAGENRALILITHDEELARRADRIVRMKDGKIAGIETT